MILSPTGSVYILLNIFSIRLLTNYFDFSMQAFNIFYTSSFIRASDRF